MFNIIDFRWFGHIIKCYPSLHTGYNFYRQIYEKKLKSQSRIFDCKRTIFNIGGFNSKLTNDHHKLIIQSWHALIFSSFNYKYYPFSSCIYIKHYLNMFIMLTEHSRDALVKKHLAWLSLILTGGPPQRWDILEEDRERAEPPRCRNFHVRCKYIPRAE